MPKFLNANSTEYFCKPVNGFVADEAGYFGNNESVFANSIKNNHMPNIESTK